MKQKTGFHKFKSQAPTAFGTADKVGEPVKRYKTLGFKENKVKNMLNVPIISANGTESDISYEDLN